MTTLRFHIYMDIISSTTVLITPRISSIQRPVLTRKILKICGSVQNAKQSTARHMLDSYLSKFLSRNRHKDENMFEKIMQQISEFTVWYFWNIIVEFCSFELLLLNFFIAFWIYFLFHEKLNCNMFFVVY